MIGWFAKGSIPVLAGMVVVLTFVLILRNHSNDEAPLGTDQKAANNAQEAASAGDETKSSPGKLVATGLTEPPAPTPMTTCLQQRGWEAVPYDGTSRGYLPNSPLPPEEQLGFLKAERYCSDRTGGGDPDAPDSDSLESLYGGVLDTKQCLEDEGYEVVETPSLAEFVEVRGAWNPHASLVAPDLGYIGDGEYVRLEGLCPNPQPR